MLERSLCPQGVYVKTTDLQHALVDIVRDFKLTLIKEKFLTVCGKCGGPIELLLDRNDPCLLDYRIPQDIPVYKCNACKQPYWWSESMNSSPARAMKVAETLYEYITTSIINENNNKSIKGVEIPNIITALYDRSNLDKNVDIKIKDFDLNNLFENRDKGLRDIANKNNIECKELINDLELNLVIKDSNEIKINNSINVEFKSIHEEIHGIEPYFTNYSGEFSGVLDYIFVSDDDFVIHDASIIPSINKDLINKLKNDSLFSSSDNNEINNDKKNINTSNKTKFCNCLIHNPIESSLPSPLW
jgi:hypothetical protein